MLKACIRCGRPSGCSCKPPIQRGRGSTRAWRTIRHQVLERDQYRCFHCGAQATTVDHYPTPVSMGGTDDPSNLVGACNACNYGWMRT